MSIWKKKEVAKEIVQDISKRYSCELLTASILSRRGITEGKDILYFTENDQRYLHNPFLFENMEDAVDRILDAKDEEEKVLIFGDRDVDGITSTTILYQCLKDLGLDVQYKLPEGDDAYGITKEVIDNFAENYGSLIITVDCGISNNEEIAYAAEKGIDVIVTDHHNPPQELPSPAIIIDPKVENSGYPFPDISGCAVAYKLVQALRFSQCSMYKQDICLMNVRPVTDAYVIECIKVENMTEKARLTETIIPGVVNIQQTRLLPFLQGQQIFVWDKPIQNKLLTKIFGTGIEFNMLDIRDEISKIIPSVANMSLLRLKSLSTIGKYNENLCTELDGFFNIFITYIQQAVFKLNNEKNNFDLQLVAIAALADIMPLKNENRILVKQGLESLNSGKIRPGLVELMARLNLIGKKNSSSDLGWNLIPALNATGRLGEPQTALELFLNPDPVQRDKIAQRIIDLNQERKKLGVEAWTYCEQAGFLSLQKYNNNLAVVHDGRINRGVTGIVTARLMKALNVPAIVITETDSCAIGSARSTRGYRITSLLDQCSEFFLNHGGHDFAAGFSLNKENLNPFLEKLQRLSALIEFPENSEEETIEIDAQLPHNYLTPEILKTVDLFEPYGEGNPGLNFYSQNMKIADATLIGNDKSHLKLTLLAGGTKWPALYWNASEKIKRDFDIGDSVDVIYQVSRNIFNGMETTQLIITDLCRSGEHEIVS